MEYMSIFKEETMCGQLHKNRNCRLSSFSSSPPPPPPPPSPPPPSPLPPPPPSSSFSPPCFLCSARTQLVTLFGEMCLHVQAFIQFNISLFISRGKFICGMRK